MASGRKLRKKKEFGVGEGMCTHPGESSPVTGGEGSVKVSMLADMLPL